MSIKSAPFYWLECDTCSMRCDYGDFSAMGEQADAIEYALDGYDWTTDGERYNCSGCPTLHKCEECGKPAGDDAADRDYLCQSCSDRILAEMAPDPCEVNR